MVSGIDNAVPRKRTLVIALSAVIVCVIAYVGYRYYVDYESRLFRKAKALEGIGELAEAINALKGYLIENPSDISAKAYLAELYQSQGNYEKAIQIWKKVHQDASLTSQEHLAVQSRVSQRNCLQSLAQAYFDSARLALESGHLTESRQFYETEYRNWLDWVQVETPADTLGMNRTDLVCKFDIASAFANIALTYWRQKDYDKAKEHLKGAKWVKYFKGIHPDFEKWVHEDFSDKLDDLASEEFDKGNFEMARIHWTQAMDSYLVANVGSDSGDAIPRLKYNCALTYLNEGKFAKGRKVFSELSKEFPHYQSKKVKEMMKDAKTILFCKKKR